VATDASYDLLRIPTYRRSERTAGNGGRAGDETTLAAPFDASVANLGLLLEAAFSPRRVLDVTLGGRLDRHSVYGVRPTARLAVVSDLGRGLTLKALCGTSFLAPSPELLYRRSAGPGDVLGNPSLLPQTAASAELALAWHPAPGVALSLSGYATRVEDLVVLRRRGLNWLADNAARLEIFGGELETSIRRGPWVLRAGLAWAHALRAADPHSTEPVLADERAAQLYPEWAGSFGASLRLPRLPLALHLDGRWSGERPSSDSNAILLEAPYRVAGFLLYDVALATEGWRPLSGREVRVRLELLDALGEAPADPGEGGVDLPSLGRRVRVVLEQRF